MSLRARLARLLGRHAAAPDLDALPDFVDSASYWESRYRLGQTSGVGSYDDLATFKAEVLNAFVQRHDVASVLELGCGDGNQLALASYPSYLGLDVSGTALRLCRKRFRRDRTKAFLPLSELGDRRAELTLSLDVVFHLVEDEVYSQHLSSLFDAATRFVCVYSSNVEVDDIGDHVRHRVFTDWVTAHRPDWQVLEHVPNPYRGQLQGAVSDFWFFAPA